MKYIVAVRRKNKVEECNFFEFDNNKSRQNFIESISKDYEYITTEIEEENEDNDFCSHNID